MKKKKYNEWISVKDELPEYEEVVLVCNEDEPSCMWFARRSNDPCGFFDLQRVGFLLCPCILREVFQLALQPQLCEPSTPNAADINQCGAVPDEAFLRIACKIHLLVWRK